MKNLTIIFLICFISTTYAQKPIKTENIFIITTDGFRWQEMFGGVDSTIMNNKVFTNDSAKVSNAFWAKTPGERRKKLLPFFWKTIAQKGQIYGNRWVGNKVNVKNPYWFSYPGYNEILTGYADYKINSNDKNQNQNTTVLEFLNNQPQLKGKVAAYSTWDVIPYIINEKRSGIPVNSGIELVKENLSVREVLLNEMQKKIPPSGSDRQDFLTYYLAKEYIEKNKPKAFFLSFDETDELAHEAKYKEYLFAANSFDKYVEDLWNYCQSQPQYKDKTTFVITTDHGRGDKIKSQWTSHGQKIADCYQIWLAVLGPDTPALGEVKSEGQLFQNQIAKTVAKFLGYDFDNGKPVGDVIESTIKK